jgi:hypothetical protein
MDNHHGGHHIEDAAENVELMHLVLKERAEMAGFPLFQVLDATKVQMCLQAAGGLVDVAAEMYWDDFLARQALSGQHDDNHNDGAAEESDTEDAAANRRPVRRHQPPQPHREPQQQRGGQQQQGHQRVRLVLPPRVRNNGLDDSGDESPMERIRSAGLLHQRGLLLRKSRRSIRKANRRSRGRLREDESVVSDDDEAIVPTKKKAAVKTNPISPSYKRRKFDHDEAMIDEDDDGYISDSDWLWQIMATREHGEVQGPSAFLWGSPDGVPTTWINAGLKVNKTGAVLLRPPDDSDLGYAKWKDRSVQGIPAPYHCRSISLVTSLVTALLYSGVGVQPGPCIAVGRQPLIEIVDKLDDMNPNETKKRLVDALTTLLHIAATASAERKRKALESMLLSDNPRKWLRIQQKLKLVPIYTIPSADMLTYEISFTNVNDLKSYVDSSIDSFTGSGGVAMLLDLIVAIHGVSALRRMGKKDEPTSIVNCTCAQRFVPSAKDAIHKLRVEAKQCPKLDTTPRDLQCIRQGNELLGLLLTGRLHATRPQLEDACKMLGVGIIAEDDTALPSLSTAKVWLVRGPTQWSVLLWDSGDFQHEHPVAHFLHLNLWYGEENGTRLQLSMRGSPDPALGADHDAPVVVHDGDKQFYPQKYRLWRYKFLPNDEWRSYHALDPKEQRAVENTVGPRLAVLLRRQWPGATIDDTSHCNPVV